MGEETVCTCRERHREHLCVLRGKGMTNRIKELTRNPNVTCFTCGEEADSEENVCAPEPLFI